MTPFPARRYVLPSCTLTRLTRGEAPDLARQVVALDPWCTLDYRADALAAQLSRPDATLARFTVRAGGHSAGLVVLRHPWLMGVYLQLLAIFPPWQGKGLGREIMVWLEEQARPHQRNLWLTVSDFNQRARLFYKEMGFSEVARLNDLISDGHDEFLLRKVL
jgi:ribosomal protein S18 acetylase RimI-like enzyme